MDKMNNHTENDQSTRHENTAIVDTVDHSVEHDVDSTNTRGEGVTSVDNDIDLSSTDVSDEEVVESSDADYDPGGYTKQVVGKWEKKGYIPTAINRASSIGARRVQQRAQRKYTQNTEKALSVRTEVSNEFQRSRRNKAFKTKLTSQHKSGKTSTQHKAADSDAPLVYAGSSNNVDELASNSANNGFLINDESSSKLYARDQNVAAEGWNLNCNTIPETDIGIFDTSLNYSQFNTLSNVDAPKVNKEEIAVSAMQCNDNIQSSVNALQSQTSELKKPEKRKRKRKYIDRSLKIIDGKKWRECAKCAKLFSTLREHREHRKTHRNDPISEPDLVIIDGKRWRECSICQKRFRTRKELTLHIRVHTREKPYECSVCGKRFRQLSSMGSHMRIHSGEKPHSCDTCGMNFSERSALKRHIRRHLGIRSFKCTMCPKAYYTSTLLRDHMNGHLIKSGEMEKFTCSLCNKAYSSPDILRAHMKSHDPEKQIKCPECSLVVLTRSHLNRHLQTHKDNTERNLLCGICGKSYVSQKSLSQHMHKHTQEYQCDKCTLSFSKECFLKAHRGIHDRQDNEPTHECPHCDDKFIFIYELKQHVKKTHSLGSHPEICLRDRNEKLYACSHCPKTYTTWRGQWKHTNNHHPDEYMDHLQNDGSV